jgi:hypothetical protein
VSIVAGLGGRFIALRSLWVMMLFAISALPASAQIQQAWVAKYNNGITNGNHQASEIAIDSSGNIYVLGVSQNANTNTGYVTIKYAPNGDQLWAARFDSTNNPTASPTGFALDSSNAVVVTGNAVTVKYDGRGNQLWVTPYSGMAVMVDLGQNVYVTGISGNFTTMKLNSAGSNVWSKTWTYQGLQNTSQAIAMDSSTNVYVAGLETESIPRTPYQNVGLLKYDLNGNQLWINSIDQVGPYGGPNVVGLVVAGDESVYTEFNFAAGLGNVSGYQTSKINPDGSSVWNDLNPTDNLISFASSLILDGFGNIIITGKYAYSGFMSSYGTYKLDTNGNYLWTNLYPMNSSGQSTALAIAVDSGDNVYVTGDSTNAGATGDIATVKYSSNGNQVWVERYDGPGHGNDAGNAIAVDNSGNVYVAGYETETNGFTSMVLIKYSPVALKRQANGDFILQASGSPGESFDVQASTNLETWEDLGDIVADTNGLAEFDDTNASLFPHRFYYTIPQ